MSESTDLLGLSRVALGCALGALHDRPGKGAYHGDALFRSLYATGDFAPETLPEFAANPELARRVRTHFHLDPIRITGRRGDAAAYKFLMELRDGMESESVVIPMRHHKSLCVSSQIGCKMGCRFCETAQMGFRRHLTAGEIVAQVMAARHILNETISNVVFMGMGEPLDNFEAVVDALRIISDARGLAIPLKAMTISTVGHVPGLLRLAELARLATPEGLPRLRLAVSVNAPDDALRAAIMPVNRLWPLAELKAALRRWPLSHKDDFIFVEYVLLAGMNDSNRHALALAEYLRGLRACVNLIPYNAGLNFPFARPPRERTAGFFHTLMGAGQPCRIRGTKGDGAMAACGQLGNRNVARALPRLEKEAL